MLRESGYRQRERLQAAHAHRRRERRRVLLPAPARHRAVRRRGHPRRRHHRPRPAAATPAPRPRRSSRSASAAAAFRFAGPQGAFTDLGRPRRHPDRHVVRRRGAGVPRGARRSTPPVTRLDGAVETSIQLGVADVIADVVETGSTLRAGRPGDLRRDDPGVRGRADHPRRRACPTGFEVFQRRIEGVLVARSYVMMDYDIEPSSVDAAVALTPGIEGPTISPLHREGWVAVRAMVPRAGCPAADGRALRPRRPRHPAHRHPCLPALTAAPVPAPAAHLAPVRRPDGRRRCSASACWSSARWRWFGFDAETQAKFTLVPARHAVFARAARRSRCGSRWSAPAWSPSRTASSSSTATGAASSTGPQVVAVHLPPGAPWVDPRPRRRHHGLGDGHPGLRRRPGASRRSASCAPSRSSRSAAEPYVLMTRSARSRVPVAGEVRLLGDRPRLPVRRERLAVALEPTRAAARRARPRPTPAR